MIDIGVQTYTIRKAQKKSISDAYLPLIELGIKNYEISRIDFSRKNALLVKKLIKKHGIEATAIQVKPKYVFNFTGKIIEFCKITGCKNVIISMLPFRCILGKEAEFYEFISLLDSKYEEYEKYGITLAYHHHNWEYVTLSNGKKRMDELISQTKKIKFVHDTYWTAKCGISPTIQIREFGERLLGVHLRDLSLHKRRLSVISRDGAIGDGVINFCEVISEAEKAGCKYFVIEQKSKTPYLDLKRSYEACKSILAKKEQLCQ